MLRHDMLAVFKVDKSPELRIRPENDVTATSAVTPVRTSLRNILLPPHMRRTRTTIARTAIYLHIVNKIRIRHNCCHLINPTNIVILFELPFGGRGNHIFHQATIPLYNCIRGKIMSQFFPQTTLPFSMVNFLKFPGSMYLLY